MGIDMQAESASEAGVIVQRGLWFEEMTEGATYRHAPGRTISEADNIFFSTMTMNPQSLHLDAAWSSTQPFGKPLVNGLLTTAVVVGLSVSQLTQGTIAANLGLTEIMHTSPVFHGDTVYAETTIAEKRVSASREGVGIVVFDHRGLNQRGETVVTFRRSALVRMRPEGSA